MKPKDLMQSTEPGPHPLDEKVSTETLLDLTIRAAVSDLLEHLAGRERKSANLHPFTTRALYASTAHLTARQLLLVLVPAQMPVQGMVPESLRRQVKFFRSESGDERGQKLELARAQCLSLLCSGQVQNADMVRAWAFVILHSATLDALHAAPEQLLEQLVDEDAATQASSDLLFDVRARIASTLTEQSGVVRRWEAQGAPNGKAAVFLNFSAALLLDQMGQGSHVWATQQRLLETVYPELNAYGDPNQ